MPLQRAASTFVAFSRAGAALAKFSATLAFTVKEVDPSTGEPEAEGYPDDYTLEDVDVVAADYIKPLAVGNFRKAWDEMEAESERADEYGLGPREGLQETLQAVAGTLGMHACESSDVVPGNARSHTALLAGTFVGDAPVLVRLQLGQDAAGNVAMKMTVRSADGDISAVIHQIVAES
jgi:coatomer protein complex subunit gamma